MNAAWWVGMQQRQAGQQWPAVLRDAPASCM
jgi:hypothetical protein